MDCHDDFSNMQPEELRAKAAEMRAQGKAHNEHAEQLCAFAEMQEFYDFCMASGMAEDPDLTVGEIIERTGNK